MNPAERILQEAHQHLDAWLQSCTRSGKVSRNTVAIGIVVLDHLRAEVPLSREAVVSAGGEIKGARSGLSNTLERYGIPRDYLKEVTTRQAHQDAQRLLDVLRWGTLLVPLHADERGSVILHLIARLVELAHDWFAQQNLKLQLDRRQAPTAWIKHLLEQARQRSQGIVEQHLVGAKLQRRFPLTPIPNHPAHAADAQTGREGDFNLGTLVYHVTATPSRRVVEKCSANIRSGKMPILLVPSDQEYRARALAQDEGIDAFVTIVSIESFVAMNIIELATENNQPFITIFEQIIALYNQHLLEVETDVSLRIDV
jgi:hypothetical protein